MIVERRIVWRILATGELIDGAVPFLPASRAVWAIPTENGWREVADMADGDGKTHA